MKVGSKELFEVVRKIVQEEIRKLVPEEIRKHLTETYIKRMVLEAAVRPGRSKPGLSELLTVNPEEGDDDHVPEAMVNTDKGIYNANDLTKPENKKKAVAENIRTLQKNLGPLAFVLENVKIPGEADDDPGIPEEKLQELSPDFQRMARLVEGANENASNKREMSSSPDAKMKELEMRRKALEVPARRG